MRINQPTGIWLLFLPCLIGLVLSSKILPMPSEFALAMFAVLFFFGSFLMRSAGCIINDLLDKDFDKKVLRTKNRPLASKKISNFSAISLLFGLLVLAFIILWQFNFKTIASGFVALFLVITYPLMKRFFNLPQLYLGITFNFGVVMASLASINHISFSHLVVYFSLILWTVIYDTIYAFQDIEDDMRIGVKSSAITINNFFKKPKIILHILNLIIFFGLIFIGLTNKFSGDFFFIAFIALVFMAFELYCCDIKNPQKCLSFFKRNIIFGILILIAIHFG